MATIAFAYRSTKKDAPLQVRLLYRLEGSKKRYSVYGKTKYELSREFWDKYQAGTQFKGENKVKQIDFDNFKKEIADFVLDAFKSVPDKSAIGKDWLEKTIHEYYNPPQPEEKNKIPDTLVDYIGYYLEQREHELSKAAVKKWGVIKNKMIRFEAKYKRRGEKYLIKDVNEGFKKDFTDYYIAENYSQNTMQRELVFIKTLCKHARMKGVETSPELDSLSLKKEKVPKVYLTFEELKEIQQLDGLGEAHDNARDWLIISCYTGQRISDFMRFDKSMIRIENNVPILEFTQVKTKKEMAIPVLPEVMAVLDKRDGEFPRRISDQRYNKYVKEVCELAGLKEMCKGKKRICIAPEGVEPTKNDYRDVLGKFEKWQLVTSHIGRRSFATNYYGKLPTTFLIGITGHSTEKMFLNYIGKGQKDLAFDAYKQLLKATK